ncbi:MAG: gliding motility-associated ABC transporter permease subunit GldF [Bacteroidetes bacterium RIFCSPLOWO2_12_FULL_35_15]|nr:MAG: gliding motility-associated ABC transporter permease subunit GldF [Bacteroidetes bacterium RIFCSPLOWO2_12_FULL_35_15]
MYTLLKKEIRSFLSSLIGYITIIVFLLVISLSMWVWKSDSNVLDNGYATIEPLFIIAPWVFLFLIPAITMRSFADEKKAGTIELLLTRPLTDLQIILAKYFAGFVLVLFSLLPTLIYYYSIHRLGNPIGNIDTGGMWGSYIGLLFLGAAFVSIGIFASAITDNQVVSFILAVFLSFMIYTGFDFLSSFALFGKIDNIILALGINSHYVSMSRGVIDTRDVIYFASLIVLFIFGTRTVLESRKW